MAWYALSTKTSGAIYFGAISNILLKVSNACISDNLSESQLDFVHVEI